MEKELYFNKALSQIPRILSLQDRDFSSPTYGCFDREFWAWKFKDFPDASLQRAVYLLGLVYSTDSEGNQYFKNEKVGDWIKAGIMYLISRQHKNGSFDQAFPNEYSYGATAFILRPAIESFIIVREKFSLTEEKIILDFIEKAANFLLENKETHGFISNHLSGAALALLRAGKVLKNEKLKKKSQDIINSIIRNQSDEGWFLEYEGPDPGYETLGISYLAKYYRETGDEKILEALERSIEFLSYFIHPDGTIGGEYGSRNTEIFYPAGLEMIKRESALARKITEIMSESILNNRTVTLKSVDRENLIPLTENYLEAYLVSDGVRKTDIKIPCEEETERLFVSSGIFIKSSKRYYCVCNGKKGGLIKIFGKGKKERILDDSGFLGKTKKGKLVSNQIFNKNAELLLDKNVLQIGTEFSEVRHEFMNSLKMIFFRIFNLVIFRNVFLGNFFKGILIRRLITQKNVYPIKSSRKITFGDEGILIEDVLSKTGNTKLERMDYGRKFSAIHMGSAKYFQQGQIRSGIQMKKIDLDEFNRENKITVLNEIKI